jgi:hypothetical protein
MATSRPFAYNPTLITIDVSEQYETLSVGFQGQPYGESPSGLKWWEGPDEDLGYCIGTSLPTGGILAPDGIYGDVTFWRTQTFSDPQFITLANRITGQNFGSSAEAVTWLNDNGYWTSYGGAPTPTPTSTPTATIGTSPTPTPTLTPTSTIGASPTPTPTTTLTPTPTSTIGASPTPTPTTTLTPTPTSTIGVTPSPTPTTYPTIFTHGAVIAVCDDFCTLNYNIETETSASNSYAGLGINDFIYGITGAGFIAYSNVSTDTEDGPFRIAQIDSNGEVLAIKVCSGGLCIDL